MSEKVLGLSSKVCPKCGACWIGGQHYWSGTGNKGNELDLAGLVCNNIETNECINPMRGERGGDTWAKRLSKLDEFEEELARKTDK
jgi:hypothetical protein